MSVLKLKIATSKPVVQLTSIFESAGGARQIAQRLVNLINQVYTGSAAGPTGLPPSINVTIQENQVQASGTITFSAQSTTNDTIIINGVTFTAAAAAGANQWANGASATASATSLAAVINASVSALVSGYVTATSALGVVTIKSAFYGLSGNQTTIAKGVDSGSVMTVSGARLTAGADDATGQTLNF